MLPIFKQAYPSLFGKGKSEIREEFLRSALFQVQEKNDAFWLRRLRLLPSRGFLRLLIPRVVSKLRIENARTTVTFCLDALATFVLVLLAGGLIIELALSRETHPREYPPEFIFGLSAAYLIAVAYDIAASRREIQKILRRA